MSEMTNKAAGRAYMGWKERLAHVVLDNRFEVRVDAAADADGAIFLLQDEVVRFLVRPDYGRAKVAGVVASLPNEKRSGRVEVEKLLRAAPVQTRVKPLIPAASFRFLDHFLISGRLSV